MYIPVVLRGGSDSLIMTVQYLAPLSQLEASSAGLLVPSQRVIVGSFGRYFRCACAAAAVPRNTIARIMSSSISASTYVAVVLMNAII